jgi:RHH-type proline utilization regulon transcriptional repressor/proline dehydrogenase/delta 1-pyrroline-5-carboxylate dehydrogenase
VIFTGSTDVARGIAQELARRDDDPVLIAETGGQNAMIVDSSALAEQVVADALASAFDSAGQRCSALRLLCLQEDVAPEMLAMLEGAMRELAVGDPRRLAVDVGPVIDADARAALVAHVAHMRSAGLRVMELPLPSECAGGTFVAPTLVDLGGIPGLAHLKREVFGPVLHVLRWKRGELRALVDAINATGYGLTHGIHTRIDETVAAILARVEAGNVYVNRNIVGAVVGVQPFGGHRLSGTGPKAGGPLYLRRLARNILAPLPTAPIALPGPTGETNTLEFHPRGVVLCIARDERTLVAQARAALALGNTVRMLREPMALAARDHLEPVDIVLTDTLDAAAIDVVLLDVSADRARRVRAELAASGGPIVPVVVWRRGECDWSRLVVERTVTVNTAAAGGNAALLSLAEDAA